ncbi:MAG TPA: endolytic transglycosylase MltG [Gammaproteobacteria bacterium]|nr:endolytic transglycosylase MltG [Gammaproteobacteria bacterium]
MRPTLLKTLLFSMSLMLLFAAIGIGYLLYIGNRPISSPAKSTTQPSVTVTLQIPSGQTLRQFSRILFQKGWVPEPYSVRIWAALDWPGKSIRTGEYAIAAHDSIRKILWAVINGQTIRYSLTVPEGRTFRQLLELLAKTPRLQHELVSRSDKEIMTQLGHQDELPEGWFFPDTYRYVAGMKSLEVLRIAYARMQTILRESWSQRQNNLAIKTPYEALILASIIEKETAVARERAMISAVFQNRLRRHMRLQTDPTVIYGMGSKFQGNLRRRDLRRDTAYNTYTRYGLPPTPIALPGKASIIAALHPADTKALYFVAMGNGRHYFSNSLAEHNRAVDRYQRSRRHKPASMHRS